MKKLKIIEYRESLNNLYNKMGFDHFEQYCSCPPFSPTKCSCKSNREHLIDLFKALLKQQAELSYQQGRDEAIKEVKEELLLALNHSEGCKHPYAHCGTEFSDIRLGFDRACREVEEVINSIH